MLTKNPSTILGSGLILFSGGVLYLVSQFSTAAEEFRALSPKFFPDLLGWTLLFLGAVIFVQGMRRPEKPVFSERPEKQAVVRAILFIFLVGAYCGVPREMDSQNTRISSRFVTMLRIPSVSYPAFPKRQYSSGVRYPFEAWNRQRL